MKTNALHVVLLSFFYVLSCSRSSEFSKYQKSDKNDLEKEHLWGNIKSVTRYYDGKIADISKYNKLGFITEFADYSNGELLEKRTYTYNEYGKIKCIDTSNKKWHSAVITLFDTWGNEVEEYEETYDIFEKNSNISIGKRLHYTYDNNYDKLGGLISRKCNRRDGSCCFEQQFNQAGKILKRTDYNEEGSISSYVNYSYRGDILVEEKTTYPGYSNYLDRYSTYYYDINGVLKKWAITYEDDSFAEIYNLEYDWKGNLIKEISTWVATTDMILSNIKKGDICHTIREYNRDKNGSIIKEMTTTYYANEDMSTPKEPEIIKNFQYKYDNHGNIIYEKDNEGHEYKYDITYY